MDRRGGIGEVSARRVFRHLQIGHGSSALAVGMLRDMEKKNRARTNVTEVTLRKSYKELQQATPTGHSKIETKIEAHVAITI